MYGGFCTMRMELSDNVAWQEYDQIVYVFNESTKEVFLFADSARDFFLSMIRHQNTGDIILDLCQEYGSENREMICSDLDIFVRDLENNGLIKKWE